MSRVSSIVVRSIRKPLMLVIPVALALGAASTAHAQARNPLERDNGNFTPQHAVSPSAPAEPTTTRFTIEKLGEALDALNYGKNTVTDNGETYYTVNLKRGTWTFPITISLSPNGNVIWVNIPLTTIPDPAKASPVALVNLLKKNAETGPIFFQISGNNRRIQITEPLSNFQMNPQILGANIERMVKVIQDTETLWQQDVINPNTAVVEQQPSTKVQNPLAPAADEPAPKVRNPLAR